MYAEHAINCLSVLYDQYGPPMEKTAEAMYFYNATRDDRDVEALGNQFCKLATTLGNDPWDHAVRVAANMDRFVKMAEWGGPVGNLGKFYSGWAEDVEKRAFLHAGRALLGAGREAGRRLLRKAVPASRQMSQAVAGKAAPALRPGSLGQVFKKELAKSKGIARAGGGSHGRGKKYISSLKNTRGAAPAVKPTATTKAAPGTSLSDKLLGGGILGIGGVGGIYAGSQLAGTPS